MVDLTGLEILAYSSLSREPYCLAVFISIINVFVVLLGVFIGVILGLVTFAFYLGLAFVLPPISSVFACFAWRSFQTSDPWKNYWMDLQSFSGDTVRYWEERNQSSKSYNRMKAQWKKTSKSFKILLDEVGRYNKIIADIDVIDQLEEAGNHVRLDDRQKVIEALRITKKDLTRALKTERILRNNQDFNPGSFSVDIVALRALQISEQASEYARLLNETVQIAVEVQKGMRNLQSRSKH
ncbi:hypothetical protein H6F94_14910 [Leptolyngbya sp. FACHB-261]|nr:hypothetical protein [Leptolyngbya sp. FACHB-261]